MSGEPLPGPTTLLDMYNFTISDNMYTGQRKDESRKNGFDGHCNYCQKALEPPWSSCWRPSKATALAVLSAGIMAATIVVIVSLHVTLTSTENKIVGIHELVNSNRRHQHQDRSRSTETTSPPIPPIRTSANLTDVRDSSTVTSQTHLADGNRSNFIRVKRIPKSPT